MAVPYIPRPHATAWVNDQVLATGKPVSAKVKVGVGGVPYSGAQPDIESPSRSSRGTRSPGLVAEGTVVNRTGEDQNRLLLYAVARKGGRVVAAGRGAIEHLKPDTKQLHYNIYFIGDPSGRGRRDRVPDDRDERRSDGRLRPCRENPGPARRALPPAARRWRPTSATASTAAGAAAVRGSTTERWWPRPARENGSASPLEASAPKRTGPARLAAGRRPGIAVLGLMLLVGVLIGKGDSGEGTTPAPVRSGGRRLDGGHRDQGWRRHLAESRAQGPSAATGHRASRDTRLSWGHCPRAAQAGRTSRRRRSRPGRRALPRSEPSIPTSTPAFPAAST